MRTLKFIVDGQIITKDPSCDFEGLVPGSENYVRLEFSFSSDWAGTKKVVSFRSILGKEYEPQALTNYSCIVPSEALKKKSFKIQVIGKNDLKKISTNKITINQNGGK